jgi:hypothetical protein
MGSPPPAGISAPALLRHPQKADIGCAITRCDIHSVIFYPLNYDEEKSPGVDWEEGLLKLLAVSWLGRPL